MSETATKAAGIVRLQSANVRRTIEFPIEVHAEDADAFYGYNLCNPFGGYRQYPKVAYTVVADERASYGTA